MPNKITIKGEIVKRYLAEFPKLNPTQMAHRIMSNDISKNHFKNIEDARNIVRCYMGKLGQKNREKMASNQFYRDKLNIPYGEKNEIKHYKIPSKVKKILLLSDIHVPYHDEIALQTALEYGIEQEIDCIILNGDFIDFYAVSRWETDYRKRNFANEIMIARNILQVIRDVFPLAHIVYKIGNHDDRWSQFLLRNELKGIDDIELSGLLKFQELGITEVKSMATIWANKLAIIHGHEHKYGMIAPVNPAKGLFLRTKQSALMSHVHRVSEHTEKTHDGKLIGCWSTGCLSELTPEFMPYNNHNHGFALIELHDKEMFTVYNKKIINGKVY
jgi:predicted phosphodiesterase